MQIRYRLQYWLADRIPGKSITTTGSAAKPTPGSRPLSLTESISAFPAYRAPNTFRFLNLEHAFDGVIDWNYGGFGKLWTYNLNYFEFLLQPDLPPETGLKLIRAYINRESELRDGLEPFPISLRTVCWIRFLTLHQIREPEVDHFLYRCWRKLRERLEYHLLGNHLLENAFALLFGAVYFADESVFSEAAQLLQEQLNEQILPDGAHFELSPMYHQLMLYRLLDAINLLSHNPIADSNSLLEILRQKAGSMLGWLRQMMFANGDLPRVNDSTAGVAPSPAALFDYAARLGVVMTPGALDASGYRKINTARFELLIDAGPVGPDYIPGHAHSDTLNFILHHRYQPLIVDTGISTYEKNTRRTLERSTAAHNTVQVAGLEQSEVWGGFRVAKRARITSLTQSDGQLMAAHNGYRHIGVQHQRSFHWNNEQLEIHDLLTGDQTACAFLHFHPRVRLQLTGQEIHGDFGTILFTAPSFTVSIQHYDYAPAFNRLVAAQRIIISFKYELKTKIRLF